MTPALVTITVAACASTPDVEPNPYTADQIVRLLRGAVAPDRILHDAARECISFELTPATAQQLLDAGATQDFVDELSRVCRLAPARALSSSRGS